MHVGKLNVRDPRVRDPAHESTIFTLRSDVDETHIRNGPDVVTISSRVVRDDEPFTVAPPSWCLITGFEVDVGPCDVAEITLRAHLDA